MGLDAGNVSGTTGNVPGRPEGFRGPTGRGHQPREATWAKCEREPAPRWAGAPPTLSPWRKKRGEGGTLAQVGLRPTRRVRHPSFPSWPPHIPPSRDAAPPRRGKPSRGRSPSLPLYIVGTFGHWRSDFCLSLGAALPFFLLLSAGAWRSPAGRPRLSIDTTPSCCWSSSPTSPSSLLDQGAGDVTGLHVC